MQLYMHLQPIFETAIAKEVEIISQIIEVNV